MLLDLNRAGRIAHLGRPVAKVGHMGATRWQAPAPARALVPMTASLGVSAHSFLATAVGPDHGGDLYQYWTGAISMNFMGFSSLRERWEANGVDRTGAYNGAFITTEIADLGAGVFAPDSTQGIETLQYLYWWALTAQAKGCPLMVLYPPWSTDAMGTSFDDDSMAKWQYNLDWLTARPEVTLDLAMLPVPRIVRAFRAFYDPRSIFSDGLHMTEPSTDSTMQSPYGMSRALEMILTGVKSTRLTGGSDMQSLINIGWDLIQGPTGYACAGLGGSVTVAPFVPAGGNPLPNPAPLP